MTDTLHRELHICLHVEMTFRDFSAAFIGMFMNSLPVMQTHGGGPLK